MSISTDFSIDYVNQRITHILNTEVFSLGELYTHLTDVFDADVQMDDLPPMSAQTPTAFTMENGWFIDPVTLQYLNGGSLATLGWNAGTYDNGIRVITLADTPTLDDNDIGTQVAYAGGTPSDTGRLVYYNNVLKKLWVRVDNTGDTFQNIATNVTVDGNSVGLITTIPVLGTPASVTGENTWANIFTLGTLAANTQVYLYQNDAQITSWWGTGHIDVLTLVKEAGVFIDSGYVTIFVRQYSKLFDHYAADLSAGARTPIPLATFDDSNNLSGYRQMVLTVASDNFTVGEIIQDDTDSTIQGIVTNSTGTAPNITVQYYLFNSTQADFSATTGGFTGLTSTETGTAVDPTNVTPASIGDITITFCDNITNLIFMEDLNNGHGPQPYDVVIDCNDNPLSDVYEYLKYITRYGSTTSINGHYGEMYTGVGDIRLDYDNEASGPFDVGETVTGTGGVSGVIVSLIDEGTTGTMVIRDVTGSFTDNLALTGGDSGATCDVFGTPEVIAPNKQAPFGAFAGGKFFGARGVWLTNVATADANNYQLIDSTNTAQIPPKSITLTVAGLLTGDQVAVFRASSNNIVDKRMYSIYADQISGIAYIDITGTAPNDTPTTGAIRVVRYSGPTAAAIILGEERYLYTAFTVASGYTRFTLTSNTTQAYDNPNDYVYIPYIDENSLTETSVSVALISTATRLITARVRKSGYLPFMIASSFFDNSITVTAVRATDPNA